MNTPTWSKLQLVNWSAFIINLVLIVNAVFGWTLNAEEIAAGAITITSTLLPLISLIFNKAEWGNEMNVFGKMKK